MRKRFKYSVLTAVCIAAATVMTGCGSKAPESVSLSSESYLMMPGGDVLELQDLVTIEGEGADESLVFSCSDTAVAEVSDDGTVTPVSEGVAEITVSSAADENVSTSAEILVYDFSGTYTGEKYIDAMGCDIRISLELNPDGTVVYYRDPMTVEIEGGGEMPGLDDQGTYETGEGALIFSQEFLGEYRMEFMFDADGQASLSGEMPTGGANTQMQLIKE